MNDINKDDVISFSPEYICQMSELALKIDIEKCISLSPMSEEHRSISLCRRIVNSSASKFMNDLFLIIVTSLFYVDVYQENVKKFQDRHLFIIVCRYKYNLLKHHHHHRYFNRRYWFSSKNDFCHSFVDQFLQHAVYHSLVSLVRCCLTGNANMNEFVTMLSIYSKLLMQHQLPRFNQIPLLYSNDYLLLDVYVLHSWVVPYRRQTMLHIK